MVGPSNSPCWGTLENELVAMKTTITELTEAAKCIQQSLKQIATGLEKASNKLAEELCSTSQKVNQNRSDHEKSMAHLCDDQEKFRAAISSRLAFFQPPQQQVPPCPGSGGGRLNWVAGPRRFKKLELTWNFRLNGEGRFVKGGSRACAAPVVGQAEAAVFFQLILVETYGTVKEMSLRGSQRVF